MIIVIAFSYLRNKEKFHTISIIWQENMLIRKHYIYGKSDKPEYDLRRAIMNYYLVWDLGLYKEPRDIWYYIDYV